MKSNEYGDLLMRVVRRFPSVAFVWLTEPGWPVSFVSENVESMLGIPAEAFLSGDVAYADLVHPDDLDHVKSELERFSGAGGPEIWEHDPYRLKRSDGSWIWVQDRTRSLRDDSGQTQGLEGIITDVSRSMQLAVRLQEALDQSAQQSREHLETIAHLSEVEAVVSSSSDLLLLLGPERRVRYVNTAFLKAVDLLDGWPSEELFGANPQTRPLFQVLENAILATHRGESQTWQGWLDLPRMGAQYFWISARPFVSDGGKLDGTIIAAKNQTNRHERTSALQRLAKAVEHVSESIVITDAEGTIEYVNPFFERTTGFSADEAVGANPSILKGGSVPEEFYHNLWETLTAGRTWKGRFINRRKNGELFTEDATISPITNDEGETTNFVAVKRDVSSEVAMMQKLQLAEQFETQAHVFRTMLPELNNNLSIITGHAELLESLNAEQQTRPESFASIREATQDITSMMASAVKRLNLSENKETTCNLAEAALNSCTMIGRILPETVSFRREITSEKLPIRLQASEVDQIITNLVLNAEEAIEDQGSIHVLVERTAWVPERLRSSSSAVYAKLVVADSGRGMSEEVIARMFDQFFSTKDNDRTSGLGLWTVQRIVSDLGGDIDVESSPGAGTRMIVWLPLDAAMASGPSRMSATGGLSGIHVLVVDDDHAFLEMTSVMLTMQGVEVTAFADPRDALSWLRASGIRPDAVVTGLLMPHLGGSELADQIRTSHPEMPIIFMSGYAEEVRRVSGDEGPTPYFLQKPFEAEALLDLVSIVLPLTDRPTS